MDETKSKECTMQDSLESARALLQDNDKIIHQKDQCSIYEFNNLDNIGKKLANAMFPDQNDQLKVAEWSSKWEEAANYSEKEEEDDIDSCSFTYFF